MMRKIFLYCGILSSLLYAAMNLFIPMFWVEYNSASQTVSELSAIDAPTRTVWVVWSIVFLLLLTAFGWGVLKSANQNRPVRVVGVLLVIYGLVSFLWPLAPMHLRGTEFTLTDTMHIVLAIATVLLMFLSIGFGAAIFGKRFRIYSYATFAMILIFGALTGLDGPRIAANEPTPLAGVWERINIGAFLLWIVVLAIALLRGKVERPQNRVAA